MRQEQHPADHKQQRTLGELAGKVVDLLVDDRRQSEQQVLQWVRIAVAVGSVLLIVLLILDVIGLIFGISLLTLLKIFALPITVGAAVPLLNWLQKKRELDVEKQSAQDEALQAYLDHISQLLIDKTPSLRNARPDDEVRTLARARTLTVLPRLDGRRKGTVVRFLYEANLIKRQHVIVDLWEADLSEADLTGVVLKDAELSGTNLHRADLYYANLMAADLREAYLNEAALNYANLTKTEVTQEQLEACRSLEGATMPNGSRPP